MARQSIFSDLGEFISAGGHIEAGIMLGTGYGAERVRNYVQRHVPSIGPGAADSFMGELAKGVEAARLFNELGPGESLSPDQIPLFPDQYGQDRQGRRVSAAADYREGPNDAAKTIRAEFEDIPTRDELDEIIDVINKSLRRKYPEKFKGKEDDTSFDFGANVKFLSRAF